MVAGNSYRVRALTTVLAATGCLFLVMQVALRSAYRERLPVDRSGFTNTRVEPATTGASPRRHLVVLFHGLSGRDLPDVRAVIQEAHPDADLLAPGYSASALSNEQPLNLVREYLWAIDEAMRERDYERITFVGYSFGALLARKVVVCVYRGCPHDFGAVDLSRSWRSRIARVVLLAGMNRGWATHCEKVVAIEQAQGVGYDNDCRARDMTWLQWLGAEVGERFGPMFGVGRMVLAVQRGQPFVANLRLEWLALQNQTEPVPPVVQLLGDVDEIVSQNDNIDQFVTSNFMFLTLSHTTHANVVNMSGPEGDERHRKFLWALTWPIDQLRRVNEPLKGANFEPEPGVRRVVMIVHGIRDDGLWAKNLGRELERADPSLKAFSRSYGYFAALYFLMPTRMDANVRWFVDQYTELRALYPKAEFSFIGHSNGTYMLAQSLERYHAVTFKRVVLAGSVVPTGFEWSRYTERLESVRNYRASNDIVVAALPSVFEHVRGFLEVGGGGHAGFVDDFARQSQSPFFARGGHGAVLSDQHNYSALVSYLLKRGGCESHEEDCEAYELPAENRTDTQSLLAKGLYRFCVFVWLGAMLLLGAMAYALSRAIRAPRRRPEPGPGGYLARIAIAGAVVTAAVVAVLRYI